MGPLSLLRLRRAIRSLVTVLMLIVLQVPGETAASRSHTPASTVRCGAWTIVPSPAAGTPNAYLEGVGGSAGNDVWAVGHQSNYSDGVWHGLFRHWNGRAWTAVAGPAGRGRFYAVAAISRTNAWAVGEGPEIVRWNGRMWSMVKSPQVTYDPREPARLLGVAALSPNNVWAVGLNWHFPTVQLIEHWDGRNWRVIRGVAGARHPLAGIATLSANDMWAVGQGIEHWNGSAWTLVAAPADAAAIAGVSRDDVWAAGGGVIQHWDGSVWRVVPSPSSSEQYTVIRGLAAISAHDIWAVGYAGHTVPHDGYAEHPFVLHWDGSAWRAVSTPATGSPDSQLLAVTSVTRGTIWAVGFAGTHRAGAVHTLIERFIPC